MWQFRSGISLGAGMFPHHHTAWLGLKWLMSGVLALLLTGCEPAKLPSPFHAAEVSAKLSHADFQLTDHHGQLRTLADFRGKVVALFFGYTHCPDVCPTTMADMAQVKRLLGNDADKLQVLFVTVDPERDTPELLAQYVPAFDATFLGLYGDLSSTASVAKTFDITYQKQPTRSGYNLDHSAGTYLIDPAGTVRLLSPFGQRAEWLADDIKLLLALSKNP